MQSSSETLSLIFGRPAVYFLKSYEVATYFVLALTDMISDLHLIEFRLLLQFDNHTKKLSKLKYHSKGIHLSFKQLSSGRSKTVILM